MKSTERYSSSTATHVKFDVYLPTVMIRYKAVVQIHHAMSEHSGRYERFAEYLAHEGFVVVVSDFPGHGTSLFNYEQGYFGIGDATKTLVEDMHRLRNIMAARYPDLPYFMIGNQLGSLVLRQYLANYGDFVQGAILLGTCGKQHFIKLKNLKDQCIAQKQFVKMLSISCFHMIKIVIIKLGIIGKWLSI